MKILVNSKKGVTKARAKMIEEIGNFLTDFLKHKFDNASMKLFI